MRARIVWVDEPTDLRVTREVLQTGRTPRDKAGSESPELGLDSRPDLALDLRLLELLNQPRGDHSDVAGFVGHLRHRFDVWHR
jgi:hypothetical protein